MLPWLVFWGLSLATSPLFAAATCSELFSGLEKAESAQIGFTQNHLGHEWSRQKLKKLVRQYAKTEDEHGLSPENFVRKLSREKPLPVIRDVEGQLRLVDNHHKFFAYVEFIGLQSESFPVYVRVLRDYTLTNPQSQKRWTADEMMQDLKRQSFVMLFDNFNPTFTDLKALPRSIIELPDLMERSLMGFLLANLPVPFKGEDFGKMIQFKLAHRMQELGIPMRADKPYSQKNIQRLTEAVLSSAELLRFLHKRLSTDLPQARRQEAEDFFTTALRALGQQEPPQAM